MNFVLSVLLDYAVPIAFLVAGIFNLLGKWGRYDSDDERTVWQKKFGVLFIVDAVLFPIAKMLPAEGPGGNRLLSIGIAVNTVFLLMYHAWRKGHNGSDDE